MTLSARCMIAFCLLFATTSYSTVGLGQSVDEQARSFHKQGVTLFNEGKFPEAAVAFRRAFELKPAWKLQYNIGQCEAASKRYGQALDAFEAYLVSGGDDVPDDRREAVTAEIRRLQPLVGVIDIPGMPANAELVVDDEVVAKGPLRGPVRVAAGPHRVVVRQGEIVLVEQQVQVGGGLSITLRTERQDSVTPPAPQPQAQPVSPPSATPDESAAPEGQHTWKWGLGWAGVGVGLAVAITGIITGVAGVSKKSEYEELCPSGACASEDDLQTGQELKDSMKSLGIVTDIFLPTGAVLLVAGSVLLISEAKGVKGSASEVSLLPVVSGQAGGLVLQGRF